MLRLNPKYKLQKKLPDAGITKDVKIAVPLKYFSNFWGTLEMTLIYCEINLILTWSSTWVITNSTDQRKLEIIDTKRYVPVVFLSTEDNAKTA